MISKFIDFNYDETTKLFRGTKNELGNERKAIKELLLEKTWLCEITNLLAINTPEPNIGDGFNFTIKKYIAYGKDAGGYKLAYVVNEHIDNLDKIVTIYTAHC